MGGNNRISQWDYLNGVLRSYLSWSWHSTYNREYIQYTWNKAVNNKAKWKTKNLIDGITWHEIRVSQVQTCYTAQYLKIFLFALLLTQCQYFLQRTARTQLPTFSKSLRQVPLEYRVLKFWDPKYCYIFWTTTTVVKFRWTSQLHILNLISTFLTLYIINNHLFSKQYFLLQLRFQFTDAKHMTVCKISEPKYWLRSPYGKVGNIPPWDFSVPVVLIPELNVCMLLV